MSFSLQGTVTRQSGLPVQGALVCLVGPLETLVDMELAAAGQLDQVAWTRVLTGFSGHRWHCWEKHVRDQVTGITWDEFKDQVIAHNPVLEEDRYVFKADKTYILPQNAPLEPSGVFWTRTLSGFSGNRWQAWERFVRGKVTGISWNEFRDQIVAQNPSLPADGWVLRSDKAYLLPQNVMRPLLTAYANTDALGRFAVAEISVPGAYELLVQASGFTELRRRLELVASQTIDVILEAIGPVLPVVPPDVIQASGGEFRLNGRPVRFVGPNIRGLVHYGDPLILNGASRDSDRAEQLSAAHGMGARVVRVFLANEKRSPDEVADRLARALQELEAHDLYVIVAFNDVHGDTPFRVRGDHDTFYTQDGMLNRDWYAAGYRQNYLPFVQLIVNRFKDQSRVFAWEIGNELKAFDSANVLPDLTTSFMHDVAREIRALDPIHLITTGIINSGNLGMGPDQAKRLYGNANLDFLTVHVYPDLANSPEIPRADQEAALARQIGKPLLIEEIGFQTGDRGVKTVAALNKWFDERGAKGVMQWGFMALRRDNGDGDRRFGMDRFFHAGDYDALAVAYRTRAQALPF